MADMKTQIKIESNAKEAAKDVKDLGKAFEKAKEEAEGAGKSLESASSAASAAADGVEVVGAASQAIGSARFSVDDLTVSLSRLQKTAAKLGKNLAATLTAPIAALTGISLKNLYDTGAIEGSTGAAREFALAVQGLRNSLKSLSLEIGSELSPYMMKLIGIVNAVMSSFSALDASTKKIVITVSLIVAALGPAVFAFSLMLKAAIGLLPVLSAMGSAFSLLGSAISSPIIAIGAIVVSISGLINVFLKLKRAGVDTGEALWMSFEFFITGFNKYVTGTLLRGISLILKGLGSLASVFSETMGGAIKNASGFVDGYVDTLDKQLSGSKGRIDSALQSIGTSAGEAFTFGLSTKMSALGDKISGWMGNINSGGQLESEIGKTLDETFKKIEAKRAEHQLNLEVAEFEHQQRMLEIDTSRDPSEHQAQREAKEREFLDRRHQLEIEALNRTIEIETKKTQAIQDENQRRVALKELSDKFSLEKAELAQKQELESVELTNKAVEKSYSERYQKASQYVDIFASGVSGAFIEVAEGAKDLGQAMSDFARSFVKQITEMILKAMIYKSVMSSIGLSSPGFSEGGMVGFASGGIVRGPGTGTSDSIPAWLSNGEYVIRAAAVKKLGSRFLDGLNGVAGGSAFRRPSSLPAFAEGGLVSGPSAAPQVVIENRGSEKQVTETSYDPKTAVTTVVIDDIGKNGPISKAMQNTFGMKRGGFS